MFYLLQSDNILGRLGGNCSRSYLIPYRLSDIITIAMGACQAKPTCSAIISFLLKITVLLGVSGVWSCNLKAYESRKLGHNFI